ncbi:MAG: hypothetical protein KUG79_17770 [Pseudomonadales bacterium]|nr:hypothetical protein [Pseudomonadales bacterium]
MRSTVRIKHYVRNSVINVDDVIGNNAVQVLVAATYMDDMDMDDMENRI